jgi:hypothetical protein
MLISIIRNRTSYSRTKNHHYSFSCSQQNSFATRCSGGKKKNRHSYSLSYPRNEKYSKC